MTKRRKTAAAASGTWDRPIASYDSSTLAVHGVSAPDPLTGAILPPVYQSTTFVQSSVEEYLDKGFSYSRTANPTVSELEKKIALLENPTGTETAAVCVATGMAATCLIFTAFLKPGDHCVLTSTSYGGTNRAARVLFAERYGINFSFVDMTDLRHIVDAITPQTKMVFSESPANPTMTVVDIAGISDICERRGLLHVCDSTFATPFMCRALEHGAHILSLSLTKFYDGHNLTTGGAVVCARKADHESIAFMRNVFGNIMAPQTAFYLLNTTKTMHLRVERQSTTAAAVAAFLETHPKVEYVRYPGLASHPQFDIAAKQHKLHGGMLCFEVKGGSAVGRQLMNSVKRPWSLCENLGAAESILTCPSVMTHANVLQEDRLAVGITDGLVRLSCGLENADDLISALKQALDEL